MAYVDRVTWLRTHILPAVLSLLLLATAQAAAVAHAAPGPAGQMELCTGTGPVMVYVDENGTPTGPPVYCPDFALSLILSLDLDPVLPPPRDAESRAIAASVVIAAAVSRGPASVRVRGPPVLG
ncbi:MAG: hypothetical protein ACPH5G_19335 [Pseudooceanicola atlanticus]